MKNYRDALQWGAKKLNTLELPLLESALLLAFSAGWSKEKLLASFPDPLPEPVKILFSDLVQRRLQGEPSAYLLGEKEFYGRPFRVTPAVLIPRPDTEILVEQAITVATEKIKNNQKEKKGYNLFDCCTGSSAIVATLASELRTLPFNFYACDISEQALAIAKENIENLGLDKKIQLFQGDLLEAFPVSLKADIIVTNPPYLTDEESDQKKEKIGCEPDLALRGGIEGLDLIKKIILQSIDRLSPKGYLLIEAAGNQMEKIETLLKSAGFTQITRTKDLAGIERVIGGQLN